MEEDIRSISVFRQTWLLTKKNWMTKRRTEFKKLLGELVLPVFYLVLLSYLVKLYKASVYPETTEEFETPQNVLDSFDFDNTNYINKSLHIVHSSLNHSEEMANFISQVYSSSKSKELPFPFKYFTSEDELMEEYSSSSNVWLAIILSESDLYSYTIRINPDLASIPLPKTKKADLDTCRGLNKVNPGLVSPTTCPVNGYWLSGFLAVQHLVDNAIILKQKGEFVTEVVKIGGYPKHSYSTGMPTFLRVIIPLYCIIPLAQLVNTLLILVVTEKENKIKSGLKMIGISDFAYWTSWFAIYGVMATMFAAMFTIVLHYMSVLKNINPVIIFLLFMLFGLSIITFSFALTPFFHKPKTAGAVGTLVMQFTGTLFMLQTFLFSSSNAVMIPLRLISSVAFTTALDTACAFEHYGGISLHELLPGEKGSGILYSLIFLAFDTLFYGFIAVYLDNVIPNEYGVAEHPLYFLSPSFWFGNGIKGQNGYSSHQDFEGIEDLNSDDIEKVHPSLMGKEAFRIRNLCKTYSSWFSKESTTAVNGVSLDIYEGQITALIGRNGAGKSTLLNMMTGLVMPSSGRCVVFGLDITKPFDMMRLRKMTGVCMQEDLHFSALTVQEHLQFYGNLRGVPKSELQIEIDELLHELELSNLKSLSPKKLSGGQKRKLSVAIALIGSPKIILLDEPSAGVDPVSRRQLWALLQKKKAGRVILLTTHGMDEADILADRKAIIHNGIVKAEGSSLFLKSRFGVGYQLIIELDENKAITTEYSDAILKRWIPESLKSSRVIANELKYTLPHSEISKFSELFGEIETKIGSGTSNMVSYGVSMTTLSEVFLKISNDLEITQENEKSDHMPHRRLSNSSTSQLSHHELVNNSPNNMNGTGDNLIPLDVELLPPKGLSIFLALCLLRLRRLLRNPQSLFFLIFMPVIFVVIGFVIVKSQTLGPLDGTIKFSVGQYSNIYPKYNLDFGFSPSSDSSVNSSLISYGINGLAYSGKFADLLPLNFPEGTLAALDIQKQQNLVNVHINGTYLHAPGIILNTVNQYFFDQKYSNGSAPKISTSSHPFPSKNIVSFDQGTFYAVFLIGPAFSFCAVGMVMELTLDREKQTRNHLRVNGVTLGMYFSSIFTLYGGLSLIVTLMQIIVILAFNIAAFTNPYAMTVVVILLVLFIPPCLLFSAAFSYLFDRMETAQSVFSQVCSWMGSIVGIAMILIDSLAPDYSMLFHTLFSFLDIFYVPFGIFYFTQKQYFRCTILGTCDSLSFDDYTGKEFTIIGIALLVQIPIYGMLLLLADVLKNGGTLEGLFHSLNITKRRSKICHTPPQTAGNEIDEDVKNETDRVSDYFARGHDALPKCVVAVQNLRKRYKVKQTKNDKGKEPWKNVVQGIDLMVEEGEVFGLLGHNGAGKTTTIKLIIAEEKPDSGQIRLCGQDIESNISEAFQKLGYCPQHDALWENITLREHIELYSVIRGVKSDARKSVVDHFLRGLQIEEHANKRANTLSGGTKRKLSYCISILGSAKIVLMDEPSTGMDIVSKRFLWNTIIGTFNGENRGAILTTHAMEEADALCTRIGILAKGSLLALGSPQHLKSKFGVGYNLEIKLKVDNFEDLSCQDEPSSLSLSPTSGRFSFVNQYFPEATLNEVFENRAIFSLPKSSIVSISQTFSLLEKIKMENSIEEYSFSQTTLEQVFLQFANNNGEDEN